MSNALTKYETRPQAAAVPQEAILDLPAMMTLAEKLVPTGFLPNHIKNPGQALAIMLTGRELGMGPMRALRSLMMVEGKVIESADSQLARFKSDGGRAQFAELSETRAVLQLRHPNGDEHAETFTIEDARKAGLANKQNWQKHPKAMLRSRVITAGLKSIGWEGGAGAYSPDEADEFTPLPRAGTALQRSIDRAEDDMVGGDTSIERDLTLDEARAMTVGFGKDMDKRLGDIPDKGLHKVADAIRAGTEAFQRTHGEKLTAIALILAEREVGMTSAEVTAAQITETLEEDDGELPFAPTAPMAGASTRIRD